MAQGPESLLRFFTFTNKNEAVGFFANRNHFAALLYVVLIFTAAWTINAGFKAGNLTDVRSLEAGTILPLTATLVLFISVIAAEAVSRSRAGLGLTIAALLAVFAMAFMDQRNRSGAQGQQAPYRCGRAGGDTCRFSSRFIGSSIASPPTRWRMRAL